MRNCQYCGYEISTDAPFCNHCGYPVDTVRNDNGFYAKRQQVFVGLVRKCPSCGAELQSTDAICPNCGHEMYTGDAFLSEFIEKLDACDRKINQEETKKQSLDNHNVSGWKSWSIGTKAFWIVVNIFGLCFPLLIYVLSCNLRNNRFTPAEKEKQLLIESFRVPAEKGAFSDSLLFIREKIGALSTHRLSGKTWQWIKLWGEKVKQISERAISVFPEDQKLLSVSNDVFSNIKKLRKKIFRKRIIIILGIGLYLTLIILAVLLTPSFDWLYRYGIGKEQFLQLALFVIVANLLSFVFLLQKPKNSNVKVCVILLIWFVTIGMGIVYCNFCFQKNYKTLEHRIEEICEEETIPRPEINKKFNCINININITSSTYKTEVIDGIEKRIAEEIRQISPYKYEITFKYEKGDIIRRTGMTEDGIIEQSIDNTGEFADDLIRFCKDKEIILGGFPKVQAKGVIVTVIIPSPSEPLLETITSDIEDIFHKTDYESCLLICNDKNGNSLWSIKISPQGIQDKINVLAVSDCLSQICDEIGKMSWESSILIENEIHCIVHASDYDKNVKKKISKEITNQLTETNVKISIKIKNDSGPLYWLNKDEFGSWIEYNAHDFRKELENICKKRPHEISFEEGPDVVKVKIQAKTGKKSESDNFEKDIQKKLNKSPFASVQLTVLSPENENYIIRESVITATNISSSKDRTT